VEELLRALAAARIGETFNPYADEGPGDVPGAAAIRLANLRAYLDERRRADVVAVGEAGGYQGMRWSGIAFTSERDLATLGAPYRPTSTGRPRGWSEPSGTVVHRVLRELRSECRVILWNAVPAHPHRRGMPLTNRRPSADEVRAGIRFAHALLELVRPRLVVAVGRVAEEALGGEATYVRHPSQGGARSFAEGMRAILGERARATTRARSEAAHGRCEARPRGARGRGGTPPRG
jgi:hypothetical protein